MCQRVWTNIVYGVRSRPTILHNSMCLRESTSTSPHATQRTLPRLTCGKDTTQTREDEDASVQIRNEYFGKPCRGRATNWKHVCQTKCPNQSTCGSFTGGVLPPQCSGLTPHCKLKSWPLKFPKHPTPPFHLTPGAGAGFWGPMGPPPRPLPLP